MATATGHGGEREVVWRVAGVVVMLGAEAEVKGRMESTGRRRALARSGSCPCTLWRHGLTWACPVLAVALFSLANGLHQQVQKREGKLKDKVR
jgi:hypothetical protein